MDKRVESLRDALQDVLFFRPRRDPELVDAMTAALTALSALPAPVVETIESIDGQKWRERLRLALAKYNAEGKPADGKKLIAAQQLLWAANDGKQTDTKTKVRANMRVVFSGDEPTTDVKDLAFLLARRGDVSAMQTALEFTSGNKSKAKSLLAQIRTLKRKGRIVFKP